MGFGVLRKIEIISQVILLSVITLSGLNCTKKLITLTKWNIIGDYIKWLSLYDPKHGSSSLNQLQFEFMTLIMFVLHIIDVLSTEESLNGFSNW
jgi:hypothetical protein